jgi:excisionase family DNA binding protein
MIKPNLLNRNQAANYLGLKSQTLSVWASTGRYKLPFIKVGRKVFYRQEELDNFLQLRTLTQTL